MPIKWTKSPITSPIYKIRQPVCLSRPYTFKVFKGGRLQVLLGLFLNTLSYLLHTKSSEDYETRKTFDTISIWKISTKWELCCVCIEEYLWWTKSINEKLENHPKQLLLSYAQPNKPIRYTIIVTIRATPQHSWLHNSCYHMHHPTTQLVTQLLLPYVPPHNPVGYTIIVIIYATPQPCCLHNCCYMCHPTN